MSEREPTGPQLTVDALEASEAEQLEAEAASEEANATPLPSFIPVETPDQRRNVLSQLLPSLAPPASARVRRLSPQPHMLERSLRSELTGDPITRPSEPITARADVSALARSSEVGPDQTPRPSGGLISTILGQTTSVATGDQGALAALRTLPRRAAADADFSDPLDAAELAKARIGLLLQLAEPSSGSTKARLLTQAAELITRQGDAERALQLYAAAVAADPTHRVAATQLRRERIKRGQLDAAAALYRAEAQQSREPRERCLALCAAVEIEARLATPQPQLLESLREAARLGRGSLLAQLLLAREQREAAVSAGGAPPVNLLSELAATLKECASIAENDSTRGLFLLEAGRVLERAGQSDSALACYEAASATEKTALGPLLGIVRLRQARGDRTGAALNLAKLSVLTADARLSVEWTRQRALILLDALNEPAQAMMSLQSVTTSHGLRTLARAAEAAGDKAEQRRAFAAWARSSGGVLQGLAFNELGWLKGKGSSKPPNPDDTAEAVSGSDALRSAAQLLQEREGLGREHALLAQVPARDPFYLSAEVLAFDAAAELGDTAQLTAALSRDVARWPEAMRIGPLFAALDLAAGEPSSSHYTHHVAQLSELAHGQPVATRYLAARAGSPEQSAKLWLLEALASNGSHAAFAAATAGRYLEIARLDPTEAYCDALDSERGYLPAALGLEIAARAHGDLTALERVHRELASASGSRHERCARQVRLGLLNADSDLTAAARWLEQAAEDVHGDAVLDELAIRLSMDQSPAHRAELLERASARQASPAFARAMKLQAAAAYEDAGLWDDAVRLYQWLRAQNPRDAFADCALLSALRHAGRTAALAGELERRAMLTNEPAARIAMLEEWALVELQRGEPERAQSVLARLLDQSPAHVPALRARQRFAMLEGDDVTLGDTSLRLAATLEEPAARAAELRLGLRAWERCGRDTNQALLAAEGRVRELWYAQRLEAVAAQTEDRARLYDALRLLSELSRERDPLERAAFALRAAEVMENVAPARAARELADALLAAREHPLAVEQLARLHKAAGDAHAAAHTFERAAALTADPRRAATLHYSAGVLFHDELDDAERAIENLSRTARSDVLFADTFTRLTQLLARTGRSHERRALIETRLRAQIEPSLAAELEWERHALCLAQGDSDEAKRALRAVLDYDPGRSEALSALAELHVSTGEYHEAADVLVHLARAAPGEGALAEVFLRLGTLYDEHLPDAKRAELALARAIALAPDDTRAFERLANLFEREGRHADALRSWERLLELPSNHGARERYTVRRAVLLDKLGQRHAAAEALEDARLSTPTSLPVLRAQHALYEREGDRVGARAHLERACEALRAAIEHAPGELAHWLGLCELLRMREHADGVQLVAATAQAFGLSHPELSLFTQPRGAGGGALRPQLLKRLAPRGALDTLRSLFQEFGDELDPFLPFDAADNEPEEPIPLDLAPRVVHGVTQLFGLSALRLTQSSKPLCLPLSAAPAVVCVGGDVFLHANDAERFFLLTRALAVATYSFALLVRSAPERVGLVLHALRQVVDPAHNVAVLDANEQARVVQALSKQIDGARRLSLKGLMVELQEQEEVAPRRLVTSALDFGTRVALTVTGNMPAALSGLLRLRGKQPEEFSLADRLELCSTDPAVRGLLSFAISDAYLEARQHAWVAAAQETG